jgi:small subunit ribosomal protein S20
MPKHKSAKKRVKTNLKRQARNRAAKSTLKSTLKIIESMPDEKNEESVRETQSVLDKAATRGLIHRNKAARLKSRKTGKPKK